MPERRQALLSAAVLFAASLGLVAGVRVTVAQSIPAPGRYQCAGSNQAAAGLSFTVGPGNIYTTKTGFRGTMSIHPLSGNVLFRGAAPHDAYQARYSAGPPPQLAFLTVDGRTGNEAGITCQLR